MSENANSAVIAENTNDEITTSTETTKTNGAKKFFTRLGKGVKEFFRKRLVGLKRRPQNIALAVYVVALLVITLNQTKISDTTAKIQHTFMGLCYFVSLLLSILGFVCIFNSFPKRSKPKWAMLGLFVLMVCIIIFCDVVYYAKVAEEFADPEGQREDYFREVQSVLVAHMILIGIAGVLTVLSPLIGKLLKKINTSVEVEGNENIEAIDTEE